MEPAENRADHMAHLLDAAHAALIATDYTRLGSLTDAIDAELTRLVEVGDRETLLQVQHRARRNEVCLLAAQRGVRAARRRVEEIKRARSGLVTYGPTGSRAEPHHGGLLTRRF